MIGLFLLALQTPTAPRVKPRPVAAKPAPAATKPAPAAAAPALPPSPWTLRENNDAAAGVRFSSVSIAGSSGYRFSVRCDLSPDPVVSVQFIPPKAFGNLGEKLVTVLPDNASAIVVNWEFLGGGAINRTVDVFRIVQAIGGAKSMRVFATDANGDPVSDGFEAPGSDALFRHVFEFCSTPYEPMTAAPPALPPAPPPPPTPKINLGTTPKLNSFRLPAPAGAASPAPAPAPTPAPKPTPTGTPR